MSEENLAKGNIWKSITKIFSKNEVKSVIPIGAISEAPRNEIDKALEPKFLFKPPFGYPRNVNLYELRRLAGTPYVDLVISAIVDTIVSTDWEIVISDGENDEALKPQQEHVKAFFDNPNTNNESFENILRKVVRDLLEIDSGVIVKQFNLKGELVGFVAKDGATFLKNPNIYGMYTDREDLLLGAQISQPQENLEGASPFMLSYADARQKAAYFQYGWIVGVQPIPFGKKELVWFERDVRTDDFYGRSKVAVLQEVVQMLLYAIEQNLNYYNDNNLPKGAISLPGATSEAVRAFEEVWKQGQVTQDVAGNWKRRPHKVPITNYDTKFTRLEFDNAEFQMLEQQQWFSKFIWNLYGATPSELGFTEDAKGMANQVVQSSSFRRRAINPILRLLEYKFNHEIINEFGYEGIEFRFNKFDVEEEQRKANLYQTQLATFKTVNEIRRQEGLEELEGGDELRSTQMANAFSGNLNNNQNNNESDNQEQDEETNQDEPLDADAEDGKEEPDSPQNKSLEGKALTTITDASLFPTNGAELATYLKRVLRDNEKKLLEVINKETPNNQLENVKSIKAIIDYLKSILNFDIMREISDNVIKAMFEKGWDSAEQKLQMNLMLNHDALEVLKKHVFDNIKGMTNEIADDLRQELERGFINAEPITKIKDRVKSVFDVGENRAENIARTEVNRAENQGELLAMKKSGKEMTKTWLAHEDERECPMCMRLDGQTVNLNSKYKDSQTGEEFECAPRHPQCRCSQLFNFTD